jgi:hypothetical protein
MLPLRWVVLTRLAMLVSGLKLAAGRYRLAVRLSGQLTTMPVYQSYL